jgi:hypothetical protein
MRYRCGGRIETPEDIEWDFAMPMACRQGNNPEKKEDPDDGNGEEVQRDLFFCRRLQD